MATEEEAKTFERLTWDRNNALGRLGKQAGKTAQGSENQYAQAAYNMMKYGNDHGLTNYILPSKKYRGS